MPRAAGPGCRVWVSAFRAWGSGDGPSGSPS